jgi:uncharacterized protein (TIGR01777 family)
VKVVIPGGSGYLGRILSRYFVGQGHEVCVLSRASSSEQAWRVVQWDAKTIGTWASEIDGADVVVNMAGRSVNCRYTEANKAEIYSSRLDSTRVVGEAIGQAIKPPSVWLQSSSATIYRHAMDRPMDEATGELGKGFSVDVCQKWEKALDDAATPNTRKVALRAAMVMGPGKGGAFYAFYDLARKGLGGPMGGGEQFVSWIHHLDFCRSIEWLITHELSGVVNLASPNPLRNKEFMKEIRDALGVKFGLPSTKWMLEIGAFFLRTETELPLKSRRAIPGRLLQEGFEFKFPTWPEACRDIIAEM